MCVSYDVEIPFMNLNNKRNSGFSLLELSVSLAVISIFIAGLLAISAQKTRQEKQVQLQEKMDMIEVALQEFRKRNGRLPCPANGSTLIADAGFGLEVATPGSCPTADDISGNIAIGVVPVRTLGLADDAIIDPWGGRFTYGVDVRMTCDLTTTASCPLGDASFNTYGPATVLAGGSITVKDGTGADRTTQAIALVLSHGQNGHGAYQLGGATAAVRKDAGSTNTEELDNCNCTSSAAAGTVDAEFSQRIAGGSGIDNFDDTLRYYLRGNFTTATELMTD